MQYDNSNDRVSSIIYDVGFIEREGSEANITGLLNDVIIKSGSQQDFFDRMKIRAIGSWWVLPIYLSEDLLLAHRAYVKTGRVRIIRNMVGSFAFDLVEDNKNFTQTSFFYPYSGVFKIEEIPIGEAKDLGAEIDEIRVSWDFNENATGMKFYSEYNRDGKLIDGVFDETINKTCNPDELNWTMGTGNQGTLLNIFHVPPLGDNINLYYNENKHGSVKDEMKALSVDSGDSLSYSDNGFSLYDNIHNYINEETTFSIIYYNFFLPPNILADDASKICTQLKQPLKYISNVQNYTPYIDIADQEATLPENISILQNYPNPFNSATTITFNLNKKTFISLKIYDSIGREINTLTYDELQPGSYNYFWNATDKSSGIYFYQIISNKSIITKKLLLIK